MTKRALSELLCTLYGPQTWPESDITDAMIAAYDETIALIESGTTYQELPTLLEAELAKARPKQRIWRGPFAAYTHDLIEERAAKLRRARRKGVNHVTARRTEG